MFGIMQVFASLADYQDANEAIPRIISFSSRPDGWKFGRGKRPCISTIVSALLVAQAFKACGAPKTGAFLNEDGTILVTGYYERWHAEILCLLDEAYNLTIESDGDVILDQPFASLGLIAKELTEQVKKWGSVTPTSVSTASTITTSISEDFKAAVFRIVRRWGRVGRLR